MQKPCKVFIFYELIFTYQISFNYYYEVLFKFFEFHVRIIHCTPTWITIRRQIPAPISEGSPYMPVITYTIACPSVITIPNTRTVNSDVKHWQTI